MSQLLPKLYSRRSDGGVQEWQVEIEGSRFRMHSGIKDGKIVTSAWTQATTKNVGRSNQTSPEQQAVLEAEALHKHRLEREYRLTVQELDSVGDQFFEPMLAKKFEDREKKLKYPVASQPKLDGMRMILDIRGAFTREGRPILTMPHVLEALAPRFAEQPDLRLDGEIYADKLKHDFNTLMSLARKSKPTPADLDQSRQMLEYHVYDCPTVPEAPFVERNRDLRLYIPTDGPVKAVETVICTTIEQLDKMYESYLEAGYEGQMVRILDSPYENKRSNNLLKRKVFQDDEFEIVEIHEGVGNRAGMAGRVDLKTKDGKVFGTDPKGDAAYKRKLLAQANSLVGSSGTVVFFNYTPDGIPRFGKLKELGL